MPKSDATKVAETISRGKEYAARFNLEARYKNALNQEIKTSDKKRAFLESEAKRLNLDINSHELNLRRRPFDLFDAALMRASKAETTEEMEKVEKLIKRLENRLPTAKVMQEFREYLISEKKGKYMPNKSNISIELRGYTAAIKEFYQMTGYVPKYALRFVTSADARYSYFSNVTREIGIGAINQEVRPHLFHELAHSIETNNPKIKAVNLAYLKEKSFNKQIETLTDYKEGVTGYNGKFMTTYMGRVYRDGSTEVLSVGMEHFSRSKEMSNLYNQDRDTFNLVLGHLSDLP